jgi:hypothetical protein
MSSVFARLRAPARIWAVASIHGEAQQLRRLHEQLLLRIEDGDRIVYLGNALGVGPAVRETVDELLGFRRCFLARPGVFADDLAYLRGAQEEMWRKLLEIQFAPDPTPVLQWMLEHGVDATLSAFGGNAQEGCASTRDGARSMTRWTNILRESMHRAPGFGEFLAALRHAAHDEADKLLLVHAGLDPERPLGAQGDTFWWNAAGFSRLTAPYAGFKRVVRGYDPAHAGLVETQHTVSLDGGCGFGGPLLAAAFDPQGGLIEVLRAESA